MVQHPFVGQVCVPPLMRACVCGASVCLSETNKTATTTKGFFFLIKNAGLISPLHPMRFVVLLLAALVLMQVAHIVLDFEYAAYSSPHGDSAIALHSQRGRPGMGGAAGQHPPSFCNFDGSVCCHTSVPVVFPATLEEVQDAVRDAVARGSRVRVTGAGHSMSEIVCDADGDTDAEQLTLLSLDRMQRVLSVKRLAEVTPSQDPQLPIDQTTAHVTVEAGIRLIELNRALRHLGLGLKNMGLIQEQSMAGLMATGVHGTGMQLPSIPSIVVSMDVVLGNGTVATWNRTSSPFLFQHARLHLGLFGVVVRVTIAVTDVYDLQRMNAVRRIDDILAEWDENQAHYRHYQFWWVPGTHYALENKIDMVEAAVVSSEPPPPRSVGAVAVCDVYRLSLDVNSQAGGMQQHTKQQQKEQQQQQRGVGRRYCRFASRNSDGEGSDAADVIPPPRLLTAAYRHFATFKTDMLFDLAVRLSYYIPSVGPLILQLIPYLEPAAEHLVGWAPDILTFPGINYHSVRYTELEYFIPYAHGKDAVRAFIAFASDPETASQCPVNSIDPVRTVRGDDVPLSPLTGWSSSNDGGGGGVALSFVLVQRPDIFVDCAKRIEKIFLSFGGRPHWGKRHPVVDAYEDVVAIYGQESVDQYRRAVGMADPVGVFRTRGLCKLLNLVACEPRRPRPLGG